MFISNKDGVEDSTPSTQKKSEVKDRLFRGQPPSRSRTGMAEIKDTTRKCSQSCEKLQIFCEFSGVFQKKGLRAENRKFSVKFQT